jgi:hypothetical protein
MICGVGQSLAWSIWKAVGHNASRLSDMYDLLRIIQLDRYRALNAWVILDLLTLSYATSARCAFCFDNAFQVTKELLPHI